MQTLWAVVQKDENEPEDRLIAVVSTKQAAKEIADNRFIDSEWVCEIKEVPFPKTMREIDSIVRPEVESIYGFCILDYDEFPDVVVVTETIGYDSPHYIGNWEQFQGCEFSLEDNRDVVHFSIPYEKENLVDFKKKATEKVNQWLKYKKNEKYKAAEEKYGNNDKEEIGMLNAMEIKKKFQEKEDEKKKNVRLTIEEIEKIYERGEYELREDLMNGKRVVLKVDTKTMLDADIELDASALKKYFVETAGFRAIEYDKEKGEFSLFI